MLNVNSKLKPAYYGGAKPQHQHDCGMCRFIGTIDKFDLYICKDTILLRRSDEPSEYWSSGLYLFGPQYWTSFHVADQKDHWNETVLVLIRELVLHGELEVLTKFS